MNFLNKNLYKGILISLTGFIFGVIISSRKNSLLSFGIIISLGLIFFISNLKNPKKIRLYFSLINFCSFITGFILGLSNILLPFKFLITGPISTLVIFFSFLFFASAVFIYGISKDSEYYPVGYTIGILCLLMAIPFSLGTLSDYSKDNLNSPYNIISPIIIILLWFLVFSFFYVAIKGHQKEKRKPTKNDSAISGIGVIGYALILVAVAITIISRIGKFISIAWTIIAVLLFILGLFLVLRNFLSWRKTKGT